MVVNIPTFRLHAYEDGREVLAMRVITGRPDSPTPVFAQDMTTLDVSAASEPPLVIALRQDRVTAALAAELKHILHAHPGSTRVHLKLVRPGGNPLLIDLCEFGVEPSNSFVADIKSLLGAAAMVTS